jgi:hypothetical protein
MAKCPICNQPVPVGKKIGNECLNDWNVMRMEISKRLQTQHGETTRENIQIKQTEMQRMDSLWKRDRAAFEKEVAAWY